MSPTFLPMNNQATVLMTTANSNTLVTAISSSNVMTTTAISLASGMISLIPAPAISIAATGQDLSFETNINAIKNVIFKLGSTVKKFISANNPSCKS